MTVAVAAVVLASSAAASHGATQRANAFRFDVRTSFDFSQGDCCLQSYFGTPTAITAPRVGAATLTTFVSQCFSTFVCVPQNSQLTMTFDTTNGSRLVLLGYAPSLGETSQTDDGTRLVVAGTWTVSPSSTGRFAGVHGAGGFLLDVVQPNGSIGGTEHIILTGTMSPVRGG